MCQIFMTRTRRIPNKRVTRDGFKKQTRKEGKELLVTRVTEFQEREGKNKKF